MVAVKSARFYKLYNCLYSDLFIVATIAQQCRYSQQNVSI